MIEGNDSLFIKTTGKKWKYLLINQLSLIDGEIIVNDNFLLIHLQVK